MRRPCLILTALLVLVGCGRSPSVEPTPEPAAAAPPATSQESPGLAPGEHRWTTADGVEIPYTVSGQGAPTVVLVHCWMCDRSFWSEQIPVLSPHYRTITLDLPGHGEAVGERAEWTVAGFGEDVAGLLEHLDLDDVVLVGHSMGGPVSLRAAALTEDRVRGIVAVDTLHDAEFDFSGEQVEQMMRAFEADFVGMCGNFVAQMFPEEGVEQIAEGVRQRSCDPTREQAGVALMRNFGTIPMTTWFEDAGVPIRAINAATPNETRIESNRQYADFDARLIEGVGHYGHMTRPEAFNPLLLETIREIVAATSSDTP